MDLIPPQFLVLSVAMLVAGLVVDRALTSAIREGQLSSGAGLAERTRWGLGCARRVFCRHNDLMQPEVHPAVETTGKAYATLGITVGLFGVGFYGAVAPYLWF